MADLLLIRHAQNQYSAEGRLAGRRPGVHLDDRGRAQAAALAEILTGFKLKAIYASPLERALETAQPIAKAQGLKVIQREGLGEVHFGRWEGRSLKALRRRKLWPMIQANPSQARFPDGESFAEAQLRIVAEIERLRATHKGRKQAIACVSHADPIKLAIAYFLGLPLDLFQRLVVEPASISILAFHGHATRLARLNDTRASRVQHPE